MIFNVFGTFVSQLMLQIKIKMQYENASNFFQLHVYYCDLFINFTTHDIPIYIFVAEYIVI